MHPDGHGVWSADGREVGFFLETDLGTENRSVLAAKLGPYYRLRAAGGPAWPVLFWMSTPAREANLLARLSGHGWRARKGRVGSHDALAGIHRIRAGRSAPPPCRHSGLHRA